MSYSIYLSLSVWFHSAFNSIQFSHSVVSNSLRPHESQHARPPCPSPTPGVHTDSRPSSQWCHPAISSSVVPSSSCPQSLPASESFPMSQLFAWGGQSTGVSASGKLCEHISTSSLFRTDLTHTLSRTSNCEKTNFCCPSHQPMVFCYGAPSAITQGSYPVHITMLWRLMGVVTQAPSWVRELLSIPKLFQ